jgi:hypothetical protein
VAEVDEHKIRLAQSSAKKPGRKVQQQLRELDEELEDEGRFNLMD